MRYPLKNWRNIKRGYTHGQKTWYSSNHLGIDLVVPKETRVYAPADGEIIKSYYGWQGGIQCLFKFSVAKKTYLMRLLHLNRYPKPGIYNEGDLIAYTGNTGSFTTGAHLHIDISKNDVILSNYYNFVDPDKFFNQLIEKSMQFYKEKKDNAVFYKGANGVFYPINSGETFKRLFGEFEDHEIIEVDVINEVQKGERLGLVI